MSGRDGRTRTVVVMSTTRHDDENGEALFRSPQETEADDDGGRHRDGGPEAMRRLQFPFEVEGEQRSGTPAG